MTASAPPPDPDASTIGLFAAVTTFAALSAAIARFVFDPRRKNLDVEVSRGQVFGLMLASFMTAITLGPLGFFLIKRFAPVLDLSDSYVAWAVFAGVVWLTGLLSSNIAAAFLNINITEKLERKIDKALGDDG